ncbi:MAG: hypothetical protein FWG77_09565 [Treponema sp.]|nr:hypothetical protein [Treponema sp.]
MALSKLTYEEKYLLGYMKGYRIGSIEVVREILIHCLNMKAKEQDTVTSKKIIQKINREIDIVFLEEIILNLMKDNISARKLEMYYDRIFLVFDEEKNKKILWICPLENEEINKYENHLS